MYDFCGLLCFLLKWHNLFYTGCNSAFYPSLCYLPKLLREHKYWHVDILRSTSPRSRVCIADKERKQHIHNCAVLKWSIDYRLQLPILIDILWPFCCLCDPASILNFQCLSKMHQIRKLLKILLTRLYLFYFRLNTTYYPILHHDPEYLRKY